MLTKVEENSVPQFLGSGVVSWMPVPTPLECSSQHTLNTDSLQSRNFGALGRCVCHDTSQLDCAYSTGLLGSPFSNIQGQFSAIVG